MKYIALLLFLLPKLNSIGQELKLLKAPEVEIDTKDQIKEQIICLCEWDAEFPGGTYTLELYLLSEFVSPAQISYYSNNQDENILVEFIVGTCGEITDLVLTNGFSIEVDEELKRVFLAMSE